MTNKTNEIITQDTDAPEVKNPAALLAKNKELLSKLAESTAALKTTQDALEAAQASASAWQTRWHKNAVLDVLDAELKAVSGVPVKYLKDVATELGLLKMRADSEGIQRPAWFDEKGEPADLSNGLYKFLHDLHNRTGNELGNVLRSSGASGSGASGSFGMGVVAPPTTPVSTPALPIPLGLR